MAIPEERISEPQDELVDCQALCEYYRNALDRLRAEHKAFVEEVEIAVGKLRRIEKALSLGGGGDGSL